MQTNAENLVVNTSNIAGQGGGGGGGGCCSLALL